MSPDLPILHVEVWLARLGRVCADIEYGAFALVNLIHTGKIWFHLAMTLYSSNQKKVYVV